MTDDFPNDYKADGQDGNFDNIGPNIPQSGK